METERQILRVLLTRKIEKRVAEFIYENTEIIRKLKMEPEEVKTLLWELLGEAVELRQKMTA